MVTEYTAEIYSFLRKLEVLILTPLRRPLLLCLSTTSSKLHLHSLLSSASTLHLSHALQSCDCIPALSSATLLPRTSSVKLDFEHWPAISALFLHPRTSLLPLLLAPRPFKFFRMHVSVLLSLCFKKQSFTCIS